MSAGAEPDGTGAQVVERVLAPLVNTNEPEARVIELPVAPFSPVRRGEPICVLETSKATEEVGAPADGWIGPLRVALDDLVEHGAPICEIYDAEPSPEDVARSPALPTAPGGGPRPRLTRRAEQMAIAAGIDLSRLPTDRFVTHRDIEELIARSGPTAEVDPDLLGAIGPDSVAVFGGGGLGRCMIEAILAGGGQVPVCVIDDRLAPGSVVSGVPVAGGRSALAALVAAGLTRAVNGVGGIGRMQDRIDVSELLARHGLAAPAVVDPSAVVSPSATLGEGAQVHAGAIVSAGAAVGRASIVNSGAIVSHDCRVGDHCHIAPGAILAGDVVVGDGTLVGMGVSVALGLRIGARARIGNGAAITGDVPDGGVVQVGTVWSGPPGVLTGR